MHLLFLAAGPLHVSHGCALGCLHTANVGLVSRIVMMNFAVDRVPSAHICNARSNC